MNINRYTKIFIKNIMFGLGNVHLSLFNKCQVYKVLEKAYIAMAPRTFDNLRDDAEIDSAKKREVLFELAQKFVDYFKAPAPATQADFDKWHKPLWSPLRDPSASSASRSSSRSPRVSIIISTRSSATPWQATPSN